MSAPIRDATDTLYHLLTVECPECKGTGDPPPEWNAFQFACRVCNGCGQIDRGEVEDPSMLDNEGDY